MPWCLAPVTNALSRLLGLPSPDFFALATDSWVVSPAEESHWSRSFYLPGQLDRVTGTTFASPDFPRDLPGGIPVTHDATVAHRMTDVWLIDGTLYCGRSRQFQHRSVGKVSLQVETEVDSATWCGSFPGFQYFGNWLIDDVVTYELARNQPAALSDKPLSLHQQAYLDLLDVQPTRQRNAHFRELIVYHDVGQNASKRLRWQAVRDRLRRQFAQPRHPGVFLLRGSSGNRRVLVDERPLAEELSRRRGFRVIDPMALSLPEILQACSGAEVILGVEGSHLVHGLAVMEADGAVLNVMPPDRFGTVLRDVAHRTGSQFGFVVGTPAGEGFSANADEIDRTLDLMQDALR